MTATGGRGLFFLGYEVRPLQHGDPALAGIGGAFVRAWVMAGSLQEARERTEQHLNASGWTILTTLKEAAVRADAGAEQDQTYLRQALTDGEVFVIDAFPVDEPDA
jgi:hypothetical protein